MKSVPPVIGFQDYARRLNDSLALTDWSAVEALGLALRDCLRRRRQVFLCGNGGSAANALHIANDLFYGITRKRGTGLRVQALPANVSLLTCLANDEGYASVYAEQLATLANPDDVLIVLSGSGNSPNIIEALHQARRMGLLSYAILGFNGGKAKALADRALHFPVEDMQIAEDLQVVVGHMLMQWLHAEAAVEAIGATP
jgi:D-sedoheptulose 7-phosphate isomerase